MTTLEVGEPCPVCGGSRRTWAQCDDDGHWASCPYCLAPSLGPLAAECADAISAALFLIDDTRFPHTAETLRAHRERLNAARAIAREEGRGVMGTATIAEARSEKLRRMLAACDELAAELGLDPIRDAAVVYDSLTGFDFAEIVWRSGVNTPSWTMSEAFLGLLKGRIVRAP